jgi:hypothetical protein
MNELEDEITAKYDGQQVLVNFSLKIVGGTNGVR